MRLKYKKIKSKYVWHQWFAWFPVKCPDSNIIVWLETIERLKQRKWDPFALEYQNWCEYRLPQTDNVSK